jgi:chaperone BCS1
MDRNTPSQELAKHMTASSPTTGSLFSQISENPFFTAVRSILAVGVAVVCSQVP